MQDSHMFIVALKDFTKSDSYHFPAHLAVSLYIYVRLCARVRVPESVRETDEV